MDATQMFLVRHAKMHVRVDGLTEGLTEAQVRGHVHPAVNPLAWHLWHVARVEDASVNLLIGRGPQVLDDRWSARLRVTRKDIGAGMTMVEVDDLCARIDLAALGTYWEAVGKRTAAVIGVLTPNDLDEVVIADRIRRAAVDEGMVEAAAGPRLQEFWRDMTRGYFLVYLPFTHIYEHIGQADLLRGMLGRPGPF